MTEEEKPTTAVDTVSLFHHVEYGSKGVPPSKRVIGSDWLDDEGPLLKPESAEWNQAVPHDEVEKLLNGFLARDMDDKWFVYTTGPDTQGKVVMHFHRSWTRVKIYEAVLVVPLEENGEVAKSEAHFSSISWTTDKEKYNGKITPEEAKKTVKEIFRWCMDVVLP
jgi:Zn-dependent metalloprotease